MAKPATYSIGDNVVVTPPENLREVFKDEAYQGVVVRGLCPSGRVDEDKYRVALLDQRRPSHNALLEFHIAPAHLRHFEI